MTDTLSSNLQGELRHAAKAGYAYISAHAPTVHRLCNEAADEIERLRDENEALRHSILHPVAVVVQPDETSGGT